MSVLYIYEIIADDIREYVIAESNTIALSLTKHCSNFEEIHVLSNNDVIVLLNYAEYYVYDYIDKHSFPHYIGNARFKENKRLYGIEIVTEEFIRGYWNPLI